MNKLKSIWSLIKAKHYAVLTSDSEQEINWALETLNNYKGIEEITK